MYKKRGGARLLARARKTATGDSPACNPAAADDDSSLPDERELRDKLEEYVAENMAKMNRDLKRAKLDDKKVCQ